jgi:hypothetical protein
MIYSVRLHRRISAMLIALIGLFAAFFVLAMVFYAGGTKYDPTQSGYSFSMNFFSDTGRTIAFSGRPNRLSAAFFAAALVPVNLALLVFHITNARFYRGRFRPWNGVATVSGVISAVAAVFIPIFPENLYPEAHMGATLVFSNLLLVMLIAYAVIIGKDSAFPKGYLGAIIGYVAYLAVYLVVLMGDFGLDNATTLVLQATGQKIAIITGFASLGALAAGMRVRVTRG